MDILCARHTWKTPFLYCFIGTVIGLTNFWTVQKLNNSHVVSTRIFTSEKGRLGVVFRNFSTKYLELMFLLDTWTKTQHSTFCFSYFSRVPEKPHEHSTIVVFGMGWRWVSGSGRVIFEAKNNGHKLWITNAMVSVRYPKNIFSNF